MILYQLTKYFIADYCLDILIKRIYWNFKVAPNLPKKYYNIISSILAGSLDKNGKFRTINFDDKNGMINIEFDYYPHAKFITINTIVKRDAS